MLRYLESIQLHRSRALSHKANYSNVFVDQKVKERVERFVTHTRDISWSTQLHRFEKFDTLPEIMKFVTPLLLVASVVAAEQSQGLRANEERDLQFILPPRPDFLRTITQTIFCSTGLSFLIPACSDCTRLNQSGSCENQSGCVFVAGGTFFDDRCFEYLPSSGAGTCDNLGKTDCRENGACVIAADLLGTATCTIDLPPP